MQARGLDRSTASTGTRVRERVDSPTYLAGVHDPDAAIARARPARLGAARGVPGARRTDPRAHPRAPAATRRRRRVTVAHARTARCRAARVALADQRVPAAAAPAAADDRAGLRLRADDRAADRGPARRDRLAAAARASATPATSSTTTGRPATAASSGAATTRSTTTAARIKPEYDAAAGDLRRARRRTSSRRSRSWRACASPTRWGGVIDTCTRFTAVLRHRLGGRVALRAGLHRPGRGRDPRSPAT